MFKITLLLLARLFFFLFYPVNKVTSYRSWLALCFEPKRLEVKSDDWLLDCEKPLFCSKFRGSKRKKKTTQVSSRERARVTYEAASRKYRGRRKTSKKKSRVFHRATHDFATRRSHVKLRYARTQLSCVFSYGFPSKRRTVCRLRGFKCWVPNVSIDYSVHRKCDVQIFIHELQHFGKQTSERSERVSFSQFCNESIKIRTKHFLCCNLFIVYIARIKHIL